MSPAEDGGALQEQGRRLLIVFHGALRALKFYPLDNDTVQTALAELQTLVSTLMDEEGALKLRLVGDFFFLNDTRLRLDISNFSTFAAFSQVLSGHEIGSVVIHDQVTREQWPAFLSLLLRPPAAEDPFLAFEERLASSSASHIEVRRVTEPGEGEQEPDAETAMQVAKGTYAKGVKAAREFLGDVRLGRVVSARKVKRAVQSIVDQVMDNEPSMITMTTLRDFDEYTYTHCVNVCIFSVVIGQRMGLDKVQLYELGLAGLLHDIGKVRVGADLINKPGALDPHEWHLMQQHPTEGLLLLFNMGGFSDVPYRQMLAAYEHHMRIDLTGYPPNRRDRKPGLFSRIVAVADGFDAATSVRSYQYQPRAADEVLREMKENPKRGFDPLIVKAFINATGAFPIGTLVFLDTYEMAVVCAVNQQKLHQPKVKVISDAMGLRVHPPEVVDLSEVDPATGRPFKQIVKTTDAQRYGIRVADYLV